MPQFRYSAVDPDSRPVTGELAAASADQARRELESQGLRVTGLEPVSTSNGGGPPDVSSGEAGAVGGWLGWVARQEPDPLGAIADMAGSGLPLSTGLRALSEEAPTRRLRTAFLRISQRLEVGEPLESALRAPQSGIPQEAILVIKTGIETGRLGLLMDKYLQLARDARELNGRMWFTLAYSIILLAAAVALCCALLIGIVPEFDELFAAFGVELPLMTHVILGLSDLLVDYGAGISVGLAVLAIAVWFGFRSLVGRARQRRLLGSIPVFGPRMRFAPLSRFCRLLALLVECRLGLPDALRTAGHSAGDANLSEGAERLVAYIEEGRSLEDAAASLPHFPPDVRNLFRWADHESAFPTALEAAGQLYAARATTQTALIAVICEPLLFGGVAVMIGGIVVAIMGPLINLMQDLI